MLVVSDLHVDHPQNRAKLAALVERMRSETADVLVVAGDLSHKLADVEWALGQFAPLSCPKLFVAGNHDVWIVREGREPVKDSWDKLGRLDEIAKAAGFVALESQNAHVGGFDFVGSMGWYDYSYASPALGLAAHEYESKRWSDLTYMDKDYARWGVKDADVVTRLMTSLETRLAAARRPVVFVSHHVPREEWVLRRGHPSWDFFNAYMGSRRLEQRLAAAGVSRFVFGHTHRPVALIEPERFVINNPLGYPRQALTPIARPFVVT
jgi:putative phosphoesterase